MFNQLLFKQIDNSALIVFRVFFGLLITLESFGAILTGWVKTVLIDPQFTFTFIGFEWLQPLPGFWMYAYYAVMGIFGVFVMLGYRYRISIIMFAIMWTITYLMQKSSYNNHYYLLIFLSVFMALVPANKYHSIDAKRNPDIISNSMPQWCSLLFVFQMAIVYTYASVAKMYPDWMDTTVVELLMKTKAHYYIIGDFLQQKWLHFFIAYAGIIFDLLVVPLLLFKKTRKYAFFASVFFHMFNSIVFQVGVFPYMSLALCLFFFEPKTIKNIFLKKKELYQKGELIVPKQHNVYVLAFCTYFIIQILLPLRHWAIKDNVLWTEEGHRLSWRMMLRIRSGRTNFKVVNKETGKQIPIRVENFVSNKQRGNISSKPDFMWQFSQFLKKKFKDEQNMDVAVYVDSRVGINGNALQPFIDPSVDLASVKWNAFAHSDWILPSKHD